MLERYIRQTLFPGIGEEGQKKLGGSRVVIIGCGALGTVIATTLVRAGVGHVRIIDRDFIEYHNLQRQVLFDEDDVRDKIPKAIAAERHLKKINSSIEIEGIVADLNMTNIGRFAHDADLILDGLDNFETRFLINDFALKNKIPWVYGGAVSSSGMTMNIIPGETACFRCLTNTVPNPEAILTCDTAGVVGPAPFVIGSLEAAEALKILVKAKEANRDLIYVDVWKSSFQHLKISPRQDCPACHGEYEFLEGRFRMRTVILCGQNSVQLLNAANREISFEELAKRLRPIEASYNDFMLSFTADDHEIVIFPYGRAIIKNTTDESIAKGLYA
ncbi:MAG: ThiF family adenylyltransferase, partial [Chloroflexi bacterium]|nr:ThiF family adenylyltransferase [Chloroflexota bacterium]